MRIKVLFTVLAGLALAACTEDSEGGTATTVGSGSATAGGSAGTDGTDSASSDPTQASADSADTGDGDTEDPDSGSGDTSGGGVSQGFINEPDGGGVGIECSVWDQDCPQGEKCMPWANDGGSSWNATKCTPLDPNPAQPGDSCTVEGNGVSGVDNCDIASMCWDVDPETNMGTCVAFCTGSEANPVCDDPNTTCSIANEGVLILCLPNCDPLLQDCADGQACYPINEFFVCAPDASGEMGLYGDPCEYLNVCDPGLFCANANVVPGCAGSLGCCSEFCDLDDPNPNSQCMGAGGGQECTPWYEEGQAPPGYENVGACAIPA